MPTIFKTSGRTLIVENIVYAQTYPDVTLLYPALYHCVRVSGEEAGKVKAQLIACGFVGTDEVLVNPNRIVAAQENGSVLSLHLDGWEKVLIVPAQFMAVLEKAARLPDPVPALETAPGEERTRRKKATAGT